MQMPTHNQNFFLIKKIKRTVFRENQQKTLHLLAFLLH